MRTEAICSLLYFIATSIGTVQADSFFIFDAGLQQSTGDYGQQTATTIEIMPLGITYIKNQWSLQLEIAYLRIKGNGTVLPAAGNVVSNPGLDNLPPNANGPPGNPNNTNNTNAELRTSTGIGDTHLGLSYTFMPNRLKDITLSVSSLIKFATADEDKNLGTGENDYYIQLNATYGTENIAPFIALGYVVTGDTEIVNYKNVVFASLGLFYPLTPRLRSQIRYDYRDRNTQQSAPFKQLNLSLEWLHSYQWAFNAGALLGLSDGAPDTGLSLGLTRYF